jgi:hypothetical protein
MATQTHSAQGVQEHYGLRAALVWSGHFLSTDRPSRLDIWNPFLNFSAFVLLRLCSYSTCYCLYKSIFVGRESVIQGHPACGKVN